MRTLAKSAFQQLNGGGGRASATAPTAAPAPVSPQLTPEQIASAYSNRRQQLLTGQSNQQAIAATLAALGLGVGLRGAQGLVNSVGRAFSEPTPTLPSAMAVEVPVPPEKVEKKRYKRAVDEWSQLVTRPLRSAAGAVGSAASATGSWLKSTFGGSQADTPLGLPEHWPKMILGPVAGGAVGYKLTDWLLDRQRKLRAQQDVDDAKEEYEQALFGKTAAAVDELYDALQEKQSTDIPGALSGAYLTYALGAPLVVGSMAYERAKKLRRKEIIDAAQRERMRQRYESSPAPVFAVPTPKLLPEKQAAPRWLRRAS